MLRRRQSGMSLIEVVIGSTILMVTALASFSGLRSAAEAMGRAKEAALRLRIRDRVNRAVIQPMNLSRSASVDASAGNLQLRNCMTADGQMCDASTNNWTPFVLHDGQSNGAMPAIAGVTAAGPTLYSGSDQSCIALGEGCKISARTYFRPECPPGQATCDQAMTISLRTEVRDEISGAVIFAESRAPASVREVRSLGTKNCPAGSNTHYEGTDEFGNPICVPNPTLDCATNAPGVPAGSPNSFVNSISFNNKSFTCNQVALQAQCPGGQYTKGFNPDGSAICGTNLEQMIIDRTEVLVKQETNFAPCPNWTMTVGLNADGSPICEQLRIMLGNTYYPVHFWGESMPWGRGLATIPGRMPNSEAIEGGGWVMKFIQPGIVNGENFLLAGATCDVPHDSWFDEDNYYGLCNCLQTRVQDNWTEFTAINWKTSPTVDPASNGCEFNYVLVGRQNVW